MIFFHEIKVTEKSVSLLFQEDLSNILPPPFLIFQIPPPPSEGGGLKFTPPLKRVDPGQLLNHLRMVQKLHENSVKSDFGL